MMAKENENARGGENSTAPSTLGCEKARKIGRIEGMIVYQKHLIENLQKENAKLVMELKSMKGQ